MYRQTFPSRVHAITHTRTHTNSAHTHTCVRRSIANDLRDIGRHVRSILPNGSSNFHFAPVMPTYVCPSFLSTSSFSLSLSLCYFRPISLPRPPPRGAIHILGIQKGKGESNKREKRKEKDGGNLPTSRIALISHPCEIASAAHLPDD